MALKKKISKADYEKLSDVLKAEYKADGDDYVLDVDGDEDTGALKRAKDREKQRADDLQRERDELKRKLDEGSDLDARKKGDIEALEKSWSKKLTDKETEFTGKLSKRDTFIQRQLIDATAKTIAGEISTVPALMAKAIKERLTVDFDGDEPTLRILDGAGKVSALTTDELKKEFLTNKEYANIIVASKASGGGASNAGKTKTSGGADDGKPFNFAAAKPNDLVAAIKAKKEQQTE